MLYNKTALTSVKSMPAKAKQDIVLEISKYIVSIDKAGATMKSMVVQYRGGGKRTSTQIWMAFSAILYGYDSKIQKSEI